MPQTTAIPRGRIDAQHILANTDAYADRPSLIGLAQMVAASALGRTVTQRRLASRATTAPHLRVIDGGKAHSAPTGPEAA